MQPNLSSLSLTLSDARLNTAAGANWGWGSEGTDHLLNPRINSHS